MKKWWLGLFMTLAAACGFPRPPDVAGDGGGGGDDDQPTGCTRDQDCGGSTPFCLDGACVACKASDSCPAARPVCDMTSHDCRTCVVDSECDSGACDVAAGTCVEQGKILYVSPGGTVTDPCTRTMPCSFEHAATVVDAARPYIVLGAGTYTQSPNFVQKTATVVGAPDAVCEADNASFNISNSTIWLRNFKTVRGHTPLQAFGTRILYMNATDSHLTIDDSDIDLSLAVALRSGLEATIRNTKFAHGLLDMRGLLNVDRSTFTAGAAVQATIGLDRVTILNSVFLSSPGSNALQIASSGGGGATGMVQVAHNTFAGGGVACSGVVNAQTVFGSNIFYNIDTLAMTSECFYAYNLIVPFSTVTGQHNITGDPMFVDAAGGDLHLTAGSPAINVSDPAPSQPNGHDHDGKPRPPGAAADLGAYEYSP